MTVGYATSKDILTRSSSLTQQGPMYGVSDTVPNWVRPSDWLPLPAVGENESKVVGLVSVADADGQFLALWAVASPGNYIVDWGDGTVETFASGTTVRNHEYNFSTISSPLLSDGSKQVIVQIYPENPATSTLTQVNLGVKYTGTTVGTLSNFFTYGWLDILVNAASLTTLVVGSGAGVSYLMKCRQFELRRSGVFGTTSQFNLGGLVSLESVPAMNFGGFANMQNMFYSCYKLRVCPPIPWQFCTNAFQMFFNCSSLVYVPDATTPMHANFTAPNSVTRAMFQGCNSLTRAPWIDTSKNINTQNMFTGCSSLQYVPNYDYSNCANTLNMFTACTSLENLPEFLNFGNVPVLNTGSMFQNCFSMLNAPDIDISGSTNMASMFLNCQSITEIPTYNTSNATSMNNMFGGCTSLNSIPVLDTSKVTNFGSAVPATALITIPAFDLSNCTTLGSIISSGAASANSISRIDATGMKVSYNVTNQHLSTAALETMFNNTSGNATSQTCTISGNFGADTVRAIASGTWSNNATTINFAGTPTNVTVGMVAYGTNVSGIWRQCSTTGGTNIVTVPSIVIKGQSRISFNTTINGITQYRVYYVIGDPSVTLAGSFQISETPNSSTPVTLTTGGMGSNNCQWEKIVTDITGTLVTLNNTLPAAGTSSTVSFRTLNQYILLLKNWAVTG